MYYSSFYTSGNYRSSISPTLPETKDIVSFGSKYLLTRYTISLSQGSYQGMTSWYLNGLVDGVWRSLHYGTNSQSSATLTFDIPPINVTGLRIVCYTRSGSNSWGYNSIIFYTTVYDNNILIKNNTDYLKYTNSNWVVVSNLEPTESNFKSGNKLSELSAIPESAWKKLTGPVEICYYTDDPAITEAQFNIETEPFTLADEFTGESINIIEYTDNPNQTESTVTLETEPFTFYEEMGESFDVLYYTDDPDKTSAELEINANYTPLDEIDEDFEVVTWTNKEIEEVSEKLVTTPRTDVIEDGAIHSTVVDLTQGTGVTSVK